MAEVSLVKQLSGTEALDSMLHELRQVLGRNGRFHSHMAYSGYRAELELKFYPAQSFVPPVEQRVEVTGGFTGFDGVVLSETPSVEVEVKIPVRSPNQVREDCDMPTPVLSQDANGNPVEKWVKRRAVPRNVVKGGDTSPRQTMVPTTIVASKEELAAR